MWRHFPSTIKVSTDRSPNVMTDLKRDVKANTKIKLPWLDRGLSQKLATPHGAVPVALQIFHVAGKLK